MLKLYAWLVTDASAMLASATDSLLDLFASLMSLVILRFLHCSRLMKSISLVMAKGKFSGFSAISFCYGLCGFIDD